MTRACLPGRRRFDVARALQAVVLAVLAAYIVQTGLGVGGAQIDAFFAGGVRTALLVAAVGACLARVVLVASERLPWLLLALGVAAAAGADISAAPPVEGGSPGAGAVGDALRLMVYPLSYVALGLLARPRVVQLNFLLWLDGLIGALALAALGVAFVVPQLIAQTGGDPAAVVGGLIYPLCDLFLLSLVLVLFACTGWRPGRSLGLASGGLALLAVGDAAMVYVNATDVALERAALALLAPTALLLIAHAAWQREPIRPQAPPMGWRVLILPALSASAVVGLLLSDHFERVPDAAVALSLATLIGVTVRVVMTYGESQRALGDARDTALADELTGLRNNRGFMEDLTRELRAAERHKRPLCVLLLDVDGLKHVNHAAGDRGGDDLLRGLAHTLRSVMRGGDAAYRIGGDEFAVMLTGERAWAGLRLSQRLRASLHGDGERVVPSVTTGIAATAGRVTRDALMAQAELALREAKGSHRGAVIYSKGLDRAGPEHDRGAPEHHLKVLATALARAVDAKDSYTRSHSETVAESCALIADELELEPARVARLRLAGLLHDVGKIGIDDAILRKPAELSAGEAEAMKTHVTVGHEIVNGAELTREADWILHHHERMDGRGYPHGLAGEQIPLESRVIHVADSFEAMTSDRPYRKARVEGDAIAELERGAGSHFDPDCVAALRRALTGSWRRTAPSPPDADELHQRASRGEVRNGGEPNGVAPAAGSHTQDGKSRVVHAAFGGR